MPAILVTGANRGLGLEFVRQYAADKWDVIACCRNPQKADKLQSLAKDNKSIRVETLDITDEKSIAALAGKLNGTSIDVLLNNAGIFSGAAKPPSAGEDDAGQEFGTIDGEAWSRVLKANTIAPILMTQAFVPHLLKGNERKVVNITSKMGSIVEMGSGYIAYRSSKAALNAAMVTIAHDLKGENITIANLHPGWVQTDMGGPNALLTPETSITNMRKTIAGLTLKNTGQFLNYDGKTLAW